MPRIYLLLLTGVWACATSVLFIKWSATDPAVLSAYRVLIAGLVLLPAFLRARRRHPGTFTRETLGATLLPAAVLGVHFILWNAGARYTLAANASLLVTLVPVAMPFLLYALAGELINRREAAGTGIALVGVVVLAWGDYRFSVDLLLGDAICFLAMVLYATYLAYARKFRDLPSVTFYLVPVYLGAGVVSAVVALLGWAAGVVELVPAGVDPLRETALILALALIPTVVGHSLVNVALRHLRGQRVAVINLGQFILAGLMAAVLLDEWPGANFYIAAALIVLGACAVIVKPGGESPKAGEEPTPP